MLDKIVKMFEFNKGTHDSIAKHIYERMQESGFYDLVLHNAEYRAGRCGEVDVIGLKNNYVVLIEVKSRNTKKSYDKAASQLKRAETHLCTSQQRIFKLYCYGSKKLFSKYSVKWLQ